MKVGSRARKFEMEEVRIKKNKMDDCDDGRVMVDVIAFQL